MKMEKISTSEKIFEKRFQEKIIQGFKNDEISDKEAAEILTNAKIKKSVAKDFVKELLESWETHNLQKEIENEYTLSDFKKAKHDRVKTGDNNRLRKEAENELNKQLHSLYDKFKTYTAVEYAEDWKQALIKFVYAMLTQGIKKDIGVARGSHNFEENPPITMFVIESILADDLLDKVVEPHADVNLYIETLKSYGVTSKSWSCVQIIKAEEAKKAEEVKKAEEAKKKLRLIKQTGLDKIKVSSSAELVWSRYIMGLQRLAECHVDEAIDRIYEQ